MFDWWDLRATIAIVVLLMILRLIGQPLWNRYVGWHLRVRHHVWVLPIFVAAGSATSVIALAFQQIRLAEVGFLVGFFVGFLLCFVVGSRCPDCGFHLQYRCSRYGPVKYRCRHCGFAWTGWPLKDSLPD